MRDEIEGRLWAEHHQGLSDLIDKAVEAVRISFERLHAIEFDAPWRRSNPSIG